MKARRREAKLARCAAVIEFHGRLLSALRSGGGPEVARVLATQPPDPTPKFIRPRRPSMKQAPSRWAQDALPDLFEPAAAARSRRPRAP